MRRQVHRPTACALIAAFAACVICVTPRPASAQDAGFLRGRDRLDLAISASIDSYDKYWLGELKVRTAGFGTVTRRSLNLWAAFGISNDVEVSMSASYVRASTDEGDQPVEASFQDLYVQAKIRVLSTELGPGVLRAVLAPSVKLPLARYENDALTAIGDGNIDLRLRGVVQYLFPHQIWAAIESGFDLRLDLPANEVPFNVIAGATVLERFSPTIFYGRVQSLDGYTIYDGPFPGIQESFHRLGAGLYVRIFDVLGVQGSMWKVLSGTNTADVFGASAGVLFHL